MKKYFLFIFTAFAFLLGNAQNNEITPKMAKKCANIELGNNSFVWQDSNGRTIHKHVTISNNGKNRNYYNPWEHISIDVPEGDSTRSFYIRNELSTYTLNGNVLTINPGNDNFTITFSFEGGKNVMEIISKYTNEKIYTYDIDYVYFFKDLKTYKTLNQEIVFEDIKAFFSSKLKKEK